MISVMIIFDKKFSKVARQIILSFVSQLKEKGYDGKLQIKVCSFICLLKSVFNYISFDKNLQFFQICCSYYF